MTTPFENFVNIALGKSVSADVTLPTADDIPVFTGIGRQVTGKTIVELGLATTTDVSTALDSANEYTDTAITKVWKDQGNYDVSVTGAWPTSANTVGAVPIKAGFLWVVDNAGTGTTLTGSVVVSNGDTLRALIDNAGNNAAHWGANEANLGYTPENQANKDTDGTLAANSDTKYPSQKAVKTYADTKQAALVSSTNIKTVNGNSLLGNGDLIVTDPEAVQRGTGNTVNATSEVVNCTDVMVNGANCTVSNSAKLIVTGDNLNINGLRFNTVKTLTFPQGSNIIGYALGSTGTYITVSSAFQKTKATSSTVVLSDAASIKPYIGFYTYGNFSDVAYHRVTVMGTLDDNNYAVFAVSTRKDTSAIVTTIQAGGGYITLAAADDGAGRLILTVGATYSNQDTITAYVESYYGNCA